MTATLDRDDRLRVYMSGGFSGGLMNTPVDMHIDVLPDTDFERVKQIVKLLTTKKENLTADEIEDLNRQGTFGVGDFGYFIEAGNNGITHDKLSSVFQGSFRKTPAIVEELEGILKQHATKQDLILKP